jgi:hypothetical protein
MIGDLRAVGKFYFLILFYGAAAFDFNISNFLFFFLKKIFRYFFMLLARYLSCILLVYLSCVFALFNEFAITYQKRKEKRDNIIFT